MTATLSQRQRKQKQALKIELHQTHQDYRDVMSLKAGRRLMWTWLTWAGVYQSSYSGHTGETYFKEGKRDIGLRLLAELQAHTLDLYVQMHKENSPSWTEQTTSYDTTNDSDPASTDE